jgi:elongator complex protein 3
LGYNSTSIRTNLAQIVKDAAEQKGIYCQCIRCCEVRDQSYITTEIQYHVAKFPASGGTEYFLSAEVPRPNRPLLLGFLRLRISPALQTSILPELQGQTAMIRELHVYGKIQEVGGQVKEGTQHLGIGKRLLNMAETLAKIHACDRIAVISGIGVRDYYARRGYRLQGSYMIKALPTTNLQSQQILQLLLCIIVGIVGILVTIL